MDRPRPRLPSWVACIAAAIGLAAASPVVAQEPQADRVADLVHVQGPIDPVTADYIEERVAAAVADGVHLVILQIDSEGTVDVPVDELAGVIANSDVPVIAWIAPRGARVIGGAARLVDAADALYRAADTSIRPSGPPASGSATSLRELLAALDGVRVQGAELETWDEERETPSVTVRFQEMDVVKRLLHAVVVPEVAFILLLLGMFGLIFELYNPGIGLAALLGAGALGLAFYGLWVLPTNWLAVAIVVAGVLLLVSDLHVAGLGLLSAAGFVLVGVGGLVLFRGAPRPVGLSVWWVIAGLLLTVLFFISVMTAALRVRLRRPVEDDDVIGAIGEAATDIAPEGTVRTNGELWRARTMETGIAAGARVQIKATEGMVLLVEPLHEGED